MSEFWNWEGWNAINSICQIIITILAFVAIIVTLNQIGNRKRVSIDCEFSIRVGKRENGEDTVGALMEIYNYGLSPVYIKSCWLGFGKDTLLNSGRAIKCCFERGFIEPGECKSIANGITACLIEEIEGNVKLSDMLFFFFESGVGKTKRIKIDMDYAEFKFEVEKCQKFLLTKRSKPEQKQLPHN